jgi:hypothetical protein
MTRPARFTVTVLADWRCIEHLNRGTRSNKTLQHQPDG